MFDDRVYKRGALTLHALRLTLGDDVFFGLLQTWTRTYRAAHRDDHGLRRPCGECGVGRPRRGLLRAWLDLPRLPELPQARRRQPHAIYAGDRTERMPR